MKKVISVVNNGVKFNVRILSKGENYGLNNMLTWDKDMEAIEFYDDRYKHTSLGQFIGRYYMETIFEHIGGLCLNGGVDAWTVSDDNIRDIKMFILRYLIMQK